MTHPPATASPAEEDLAGVAARTAMQVRNQFFLWMRLGVRAWEATSVVAQGHQHRALLLAAAAGCAAFDVALAVLLHRRIRVPLLLRGAVDVVDVTGWSFVLGPGSVAPQAAGPICLELALRFGWRGLAGPLAIGAAVTALLLAAGRPLEPGDASLFLWTGMTGVAGIVVTRYLRARVDRQRRQAAAEAEAAASQAELAGQHSIAVGADTVIDLLTRTAPLLAPDGALPRPSPLSAWKAALAGASSGQASYLHIALARWQRSWNMASPDLKAHVELQCAPGAGALLLSSFQVGALWRLLDGLDLRGRVAVDVPDPDLPGCEQVLLIGGERVLVPADPRPPVRSMDAGPTVFVLAVFLYLAHSLPTLEQVPLWASGPTAAAAGGLALWSHRHLTRTGPAGYRQVIAAALALGACDAVLSTLTMRNPFPDHVAGVPGAVFPAWFAPLFLISGRDLTRGARLLFGGLAAGIVALSFALLPAPIPGWQVPVALIWPAVSVMICLGLRDLLDRDAEDFGEELEAARRDAVARAFQRGRALVIDLAAEAAAEARRDYTAVRSRLAADVSAEAARRLREVEARLAALRGAAVP